ncbi:MAG: nucleotidyltransferase [Firmicutes bacterium]|nr:nucleotidyltransferase [Bacillota bacterium]
MTLKEIRWKQRFENFRKAYAQFESAVLAYKDLNRLELEGMIKRFEYTFELAWKTLKDYLEAEGVEASFPREVIKAAFQYNVIEDGETWMEMLESRNLMVHTYSEERFLSVVTKVVSFYYPAITQVLRYLEGQL